MTTVRVLTHCVHPVFAYASMMVFDTIRTGYPTARIEVADNGSHPDVLPRIRRAAEAVGATFEARPLMHYSDVWRENLFGQTWPEGPVVFLDPDVVLWENCEHWNFGDALLAGRLIPELPHGHRAHAGRLHPSHLWVPSMSRFRSEFARRFPSEVEGGWDCIGPAPAPHAMRYYNTLAPLYAALRDDCAAFGTEQLDAYDHLHLGSHLATGSGRCDLIEDAHRRVAQGDVASLRGLWKLQDATFLSPAATPPRPWRQPLTAADIRDWQGLDFSDREMEGVQNRLSIRLTTERPSHHGSPYPPRQHAPEGGAL